MASRFQAALLVASPSYPNAVAWSDENLVAVASGPIVTILNPDMPFGGPRGLITIPASKPFPIGVIESKDLLSGSILPLSLYRAVGPCARSISWSPIGLSPNSGCLLAVCTTEGRVKLYRFPFCEFSAEWVEVVDISEMLYTYLANVSFRELDICTSEISNGHASRHGTESQYGDDLPISLLRKDPKRRRHNESTKSKRNSRRLFSFSGKSKNANSSSGACTEKTLYAFTEISLFPCSLLQEGSSVEVFMLDGNQRVWIAGKLNQLVDGKALVIFPENDGSGKRDKWVKVDPQYDISGPNPHKTVVDLKKHFPKIRPSMIVDELPEQILDSCGGVEDILKIGQTVEAWTNDRWFEGMFMGLNESGVQVELSGDTQLVTLNTSSVRLAPIWVSEQKSWQVTVVKIGIRGQNMHEAVGTKADSLKEVLQIVSVPKSKAKTMSKVPENFSIPLISADEYASRNSMLSSLVVAWSPILQIPSELAHISPDSSSNCCSILAVGGKSGRISLWKICKPQCYSLLHSKDPTSASLIGFLQAHKSWITAISWALFYPDSSSPELFLATGSSDGSVKIWQGFSAEMLNSSEVIHAFFSLFEEVITVGSDPVSILSLIVPVHSTKRLLLAIGKGSGSLEVWMCDISTRKFHKAGSYDAHDHIVTGLAWGFNGSYLYSCSQDNSVCSWMLHGNSLCEVSLPSTTPGAKSSADVPNVFDLCFGLALSPGNLVVAVARNFDADVLNPMYQLRTQKAAVEFFWTGGQKLDTWLNNYPDFNIEAFPGFSDKELIYWEHNILWTLNQNGHVYKPLVIWDAVEVLLGFKQLAPKYVDHILAKWLCSYVEPKSELSPALILSAVSSSLSNIPSRQLHLLNIIIRRVMLTELKADDINSENQSLEGMCGLEDEQTEFWIKLLKSSERELRERLVGYSFAAVIDLVSHSSTNHSKTGYWKPGGLAQMQQWVRINQDNVRDSLKSLASVVKKLKKSRLYSVIEYVAEEQCIYCSAPVPFESTEAAFCRGAKCNSGGDVQSHKLERCAVSMLLIPITPTWFCMCCHRRVSNFAPQALFTMLGYPEYIDSSSTSSTGIVVLNHPLCPFCGILLQRLQPEFLLSVTPV